MNTIRVAAKTRPAYELESKEGDIKMASTAAASPSSEVQLTQSHTGNNTKSEKVVVEKVQEQSLQVIKLRACA